MSPSNGDLGQPVGAHEPTGGAAGTAGRSVERGGPWVRPGAATRTP
ncbi:hypothetical protein WMF45_29395 [Sorangium sp. So ce448]